MTFDQDIWCDGLSLSYAGQIRGSRYRLKLEVTGGKMLPLLAESKKVKLGKPIPVT